MQKAKFSSKRTQKCPDIGSIHKKYVYEDSKRPFQLLGDVANGLLMSSGYKNEDTTENTKVYGICYTERKDSLYLMNRVLEIGKSLYFVSNERFINS